MVDIRDNSPVKEIQKLLKTFDFLKKIVSIDNKVRCSFIDLCNTNEWQCNDGNNIPSEEQIYHFICTTRINHDESDECR